MKKPITKWIIVAIFILLVAYSGFATYSWLEGERIQNLKLNNAIDVSDIPLWELSTIGFEAESLIEPDTSDELLRERIIQYFSHTRTLWHSSSILHTLTDDEKYWLFNDAMFNLNRFFTEINNRPNTKEILTTNLDTLKQMDDILDEILQIDDLTLADTWEILQLSHNLTVS